MDTLSAIEVEWLAQQGFALLVSVGLVARAFGNWRWARKHKKAHTGFPLMTLGTFARGLLFMVGHLLYLAVGVIAAQTPEPVRAANAEARNLSIALLLLGGWSFLAAQITDAVVSYVLIRRAARPRGPKGSGE